MKRVGIKYQLRITTLIPVLLVALLFALFYNGQFNRDLKQHVSHLGEAYIRQLLPAAQLALLSSDYRTLQGLTDASAINSEVKAIAFFNANGQLLAYRGGKHSLKKPFTPPQYTGDFVESKPISPNTIHFVAPITVPKFNLYSFLPFEAPNSPIAIQADDVLGWLAIDIDTQSTLIKRYKMYIVTIFITLLGLLIGLTVHYFFSRKIYLPIGRLRRSMKQILSNEFETEIKVSCAGEIGIIEEGCAHLQQQYLNVINELNQHIEVATADLQTNLELLEEKNIELTLEKKKAEEKARQQSEFIANMSHEIRTPMNGILGFINVLSESKLDPLQLDYVKTIRSSAQDLLTIINDILDFSKMDAGKLHLDSLPLDIRACIDDVLSLATPIAHKKGIELIPSTAINVPKTVLGDPLRLKQIISNLVNNAIKFTDHGYVLIRTHVEQESDKEYALCLSVIDTGIGITAEEQSTLFSAFNQANAKITRRFGGSGLGLVICKKLAEHMHGKITLTSEIHKGSTFSIHIKLTKLAAYEIEKHQTHRFAQIKVICFDDNPLHLEAISNGLGHWGMNCINVQSFQQLEDTFLSHADAKIAFINVNQGCEQQVAHILRKQHIPCILLSKWVIQDYAALGAQGVLFKPPNIQKLYETIESLVYHSPRITGDNVALAHLRQQLHAIHPNILIAEDNPVNCRLLHSLLNENAHIKTVEDGEQAVAICQQQRFHIILLDLQMPKMNGLDAAHAIRKHSLLNQNTPMMLITANSTDLNHERIQSVGIDRCLQKPIQEALLIQHLLECISKTNSHAINWPLCMQKVSGNRALAIDYLAEFVKELKKNRREFVTLMRDKEIPALAQLAHRLHGACCFCGVPQLQIQVAEFEHVAKNAQNSDELATIFVRLLSAIDAVLAEYTQNYPKNITVIPL